jgi:precorrin-6B methylase 1
MLKNNNRASSRMWLLEALGSTDARRCQGLMAALADHTNLEHLGKMKNIQTCMGSSLPRRIQ